MTRRALLLGFLLLSAFAVDLPPESSRACGFIYGEDCIYDDTEQGWPPYTERDRERDIMDCLDYRADQYGGQENIPYDVAQECYDQP